MSKRTTKQQVRNQILLSRYAIAENAKKKYDEQICEQLIKLVAKESSQIIHSYLPLDSEINILPFIQWALQNQKTIICPKTEQNSQLTHLMLESLEEIERGLYGTTHPSSNKIYTGSYDLILVPVVGLTSSLYRLGYGGGYYDRFLAKHKAVSKVAVAYPFQLYLNFSVEDHDAKMDIVLSSEL